MIKLCILKMARQFVENLGRGIHKKRVNDSKSSFNKTDNTFCVTLYKWSTF